MVKPVLVGFNVLLILLFGLFQKGNIEITHNLPDSLEPGGDAVVTVEVNKSDVSGFAKYQITVAEGLTIEPIETAGSSFTFNNQKGKFIWMALPTSKKFTLQYRIIADKSLNGAFNVASRFSYIYDSERKNYDLLDKELIVGEGAALAAAESEEVITEASTNADAQVSMIRTMTPSGINHWKVNISLDKQNLEGFARIEETIPEGYTAIDLQSSSAVFVSENEKVKYIWYDIPQNNHIAVSYKLMPVIAVEPVQPEITGTFTYLTGDDEIEVPIGKGTPDLIEDDLLVENKDTTDASVSDMEDQDGGKPVIDGADIATAMTITSDEEVEGSEDENAETFTNESNAEESELVENQPEKTTTQKESTESSPVQTDVVVSKSNVNNNIVNVPSPQTGITYRVQIAAGHNNLRKTEFEKLYNFPEGYTLESIDGWLKYTTGSHEYYKEARNDRERISSQYDKFQGPFVTAYNDGERITVQEALMITNQEWLQ
jgi:hypothetical protein